MIKIITKETFMPDLKKSIHYISWTPRNPMSITGYSGLDWVDAIVRQNVKGIDRDAVYGRIDCENDTMTLYPEAGITIMPNGRQYYPDADIYRHFREAMKAQKQFVQAENILFDMRNYCYFNPHTRCIDNDEYLRMIHNETDGMCIADGRQVNVYVLMSPAPDNVEGKYYLDFATDAEVENLCRCHDG